MPLPDNVLATSASRRELLRELAEFASPSFVAKASEMSTDEQIAGYIEGAKSIADARRRAGIRDLRKAQA